MNLDQIQQLLTLSDKFRSIRRVVFTPGTRLQENDAEHSYELMLLCWFLAIKRNQENDKQLNLEKVFTYALVHDLVEAYAGDTNSLDESAQAGKEAREHVALERIEHEFSFFPELAEYITEYEQQTDPESRFVKSVDKLLPALSGMRDEFSAYREFNATVTLSQIDAIKKRKISDPDVLAIWLEMKKQIEADGGFSWAEALKES